MALCDTAVPRFLHPEVWSALREIGARFAAQGLHVFLFGSFAAGTQRPGSDLDIGYEPTSKTSLDLVAELRRVVEDLPTVRQVDLVDFSKADPDFVRVARAHVRELA